MKTSFILLAIFFISMTNTKAQFEDEGMPDILTIGAGVGFTSFLGDLSLNSEVSAFSNIRTAYNFSWNIILEGFNRMGQNYST